MTRVLAVAGLLTTVLLFAGCTPTRQAEDDPLPRDPNCKTSLNGRLETQHLARIRREAHALDAAGAWVSHDEKAVAIQPLCESHKKNEPELRRGEFVARLMIVGESTPYSGLTTDMVYMWVFREGSGDFAQFVSMTNPDAGNAIKTYALHSCTMTTPNEEEVADWHEGVCSAHSETGGRPRGGDNPWFGCTRGCCYAAAPVGES